MICFLRFHYHGLQLPLWDLLLNRSLQSLDFERSSLWMVLSILWVALWPTITNAMTGYIAENNTLVKWGRMAMAISQLSVTWPTWPFSFTTRPPSRPSLPEALQLPLVPFYSAVVQMQHRGENCIKVRVFISYQ
jgi:hypothetical protein